MARRKLSPTEIGDIVQTACKAAGLWQDELDSVAAMGRRFIVDLEARYPTAKLVKALQLLAALDWSSDITSPPEPKGSGKA